MSSWKNSLILASISLIKFFKKEDNAISKKPHSRVLVISTTGLGDTLFATPAISALKSSYPNIYLGVLTSPIGNQVLKNSPHVDEIFFIKDKSFFSFFPLLFKIRKKRFDTVFIFHASQRLIFPFAYLTGASHIIGNTGMNKGLDSLLTFTIPSKYQHEIERRMDLIRSIFTVHCHGEMKVFPKNHDQATVCVFLRKNNIDQTRPCIALHPGAKDGFKMWPIENFAKIGKELISIYNAQIFISGSSLEKNLIDSLMDQIPSAISLIDTFSIPELAAFFEKIDLVISNDTGPMHLALASKAKTICLFSPTDPNLCGPWNGADAQIIAKKKTCYYCTRKKCNEPFCMRQITPHEVLEKANKMLTKELVST